MPNETQNPYNPGHPMYNTWLQDNPPAPTPGPSPTVNPAPNLIELTYSDPGGTPPSGPKEVLPTVPDPAAPEGGTTLQDIDERHDPIIEHTGQQAAGPQLQPGTEFTFQDMVAQPNEFQQMTQVEGTPQVDTTITGEAPQVAAPDTFDAAQTDPFTQFAASQMSPEQLATLSDEAKAEAAQGTVSPETTVQFQLASLLDQFDDGEIPPWAAGAIGQANRAMQQRGLGRSSMAGSALTQAAMEAATPIAQHDAQVHERIQQANLQNRQQAIIFNAQQAGSLDMTNLSNSQQASLASHQARQQKLLSDQAAINASKQFNATSQNQVDQFFAQIGSQIAENNANRIAAQDQFNVDQVNAHKRFNASLSDARDKFNAEARMVIDQSNTAWRRNINTVNNMEQNRANQLNTQNLFGMSQSAQANLWQQYRDEASWVMTSSENAKTRAANLTMAALQRSYQNELMDEAGQQAFNQLLGKFAFNIFESKFGEN